jgi:Alcohol dehydrogenase transcription factor Myb/SANT-like
MAFSFTDEFTLDELKLKWKQLRDRYNKHKSKANHQKKRTKLPSGSGGTTKAMMKTN